jgi:hypothetical protein
MIIGGRRGFFTALTTPIINISLAEASDGGLQKRRSQRFDCPAVTLNSALAQRGGCGLKPEFGDFSERQTRKFGVTIFMG